MLDLSYSRLDEFKEPKFKAYGFEDSNKKSNVVCDKKLDDSKENSDGSLVKEQVSKDSSSSVESSLNVNKETVFSIDKKGKTQQDDTGFVDSGCSRHMTGNITYLLDFKEFYKRLCYIGVREHMEMCDKKNYVLFTDNECFVLSPNFKLPDKTQILLKIPRKDNMYSFDMKNIVPKESLTCLVAKATLDESMLWHRRLGHINFKNINKLVKDNLVRGLPIKCFENDQTCVACLKGKQHRASSSKDETSEIRKNFIKEIENLGDKKVKIIRSGNGTKFKNKVMDDFYREKGIKREYSVAKTPQQNGVAERRNRTLIEAARTILGKFDGKSNEGFFVGYSLSSKDFRVYNNRTRRVEENLHIRFLENKTMIEGNGPKWLFDINSLTQSMNYVPIAVGTITNESAGNPKRLNAAELKDGPDNENDEKDKSKDDSSPKEVNTARQQVNTASPEVNTGRNLQTLNLLIQSVNTAMFIMIKMA
ncbi:putative ribonuclease H-like domain-containing protein [Tanacetum coccineum]